MNNSNNQPSADGQPRRPHQNNNRRFSQNRPNRDNQQQNQPRAARPDNSVLAKTQIRRGEVQRAQRRTSENVNMQASQHIIDVPVNKSVFNGYGGQQFTLNMQKTIPRREGQTLKVIPLGGLAEMGIGKNMMAIEYGDDIIVIDMGFLFPGNDYPGINYIVPDISYLEERKDKIRGIIFTHGHLDHIGAVRHLLHKMPVPVYGGKFTLGMVQKIMEESDTDYRPVYNIMNPEAHDRVQLGSSFGIELVRVNHSIPDSTAVVIRTPVGVLINTGDWRFEEDPVDGVKFDLARLEQVSREEGLLLLMNDSTNCEDAGSHQHGEKDIQVSLGQIMDNSKSSRLIVSCFSSQIHRMQLIMQEAKAHGRKVAIAGYSMIQNIEVAIRTGAINVPSDTIMRMEDIVKLPDSQVAIICTGSQGEFNAVLNRMASGAHKNLKIKNTDLIVFSSSVVPGNEKYVVRTVDNLMREGADAIQDRRTHLYNIGRIHLSGHGYYDDHVKLIHALKPKYYMPIHGEFHMLVHNSELAQKECGIPRERILVCDNGDVVEADQQGIIRKAGRVPVGGVMYDDSGTEVSEVVLKDRIHMAAEGMFIVVLTVDRRTGRLMTSPDIISRGFIYLRDSEELMNTVRSYLKQKIARTYGGRGVDLDAFKKELKDEITHILYDKTRRTPIVIPVVNEIGSSQQAPGLGAQDVQQPVQSVQRVAEYRMATPSQPKHNPRVGGY